MPLLFPLVGVVTSARVLITPIGATSVLRQPDLLPVPPTTVSEPAKEAAPPDELDTCSCYSWLPSKCTRLLRGSRVEHGNVVPTAQSMPMGPDTARVRLEECGATIGDNVIPPDSCQGGYYGYDSSIDPDHVLEHGLPARGDDWDLIRHAEQAGYSAFRGTTKLVTFPNGGGAAAWADEGGYVFEVTCVPTWDVNKHIQGRRLIADGVGKWRYGGNLVSGEYEHAIPARVLPEHIKRYGCVVASASGMLFVPRNAWVGNPRWDACFCKYSVSECEEEPCPEF